MTCRHKAIALTYDIKRLSEVDGGPVRAYSINGNAFCYECKIEYRVFHVKLTPGILTIGAKPCQHENFETKIAVDSASRKRKIVAANVTCFDCGMAFVPVQFELEPVEKDAGLVLPSDEEMEQIGKDAQSIH